MAEAPRQALTRHLAPAFAAFGTSTAGYWLRLMAYAGAALHAAITKTAVAHHASRTRSS